ncbi:hypothetical protein [Streptomyces sp. NPDC002952]|uniref:hypothetical protein n=1 Tax=Streptomyces sp. NPDC002952 TaxID=3364673 RepID=UPI0036AB14DE
MKTTLRKAVMLLSAGLLLSGCSNSGGNATDSQHAAPTLPARTGVLDEQHKGPAHPKELKAYPYDIYTHCGIKWAEFGGRWWVLDSVLPGAEQVKGEAQSHDSETLAGYMTLTSPDTANFDAAGTPTLQFVPSKVDPPGCK